MSKSCLIFAAHPDDETNGVGGTMISLLENGWELHIVYATLPIDRKLGRRREQACRKVGRFLNAKVTLWRLPDGQLDVTAMTAGLTRKAYLETMPDLVLVMNPMDVHPDHRAMANLAMGPAFQYGSNTELMLYELCSSGRHTDSDRPQTLCHFPTHYVDITYMVNVIATMQRFHDTEDPEAMVRGMRIVHGNRAVEYGFKPGYFMEGLVRLTRVGELQHGLEEIFLPGPFTLPRPIGIDFKPRDIGL